MAAIAVYSDYKSPYTYLSKDKIYTLAAEAEGVFGVPSFVVEGELFCGSERLPDIHTLLTQRL